MNLIQEIYQKDVGFENERELVKYEVRKAARAVLLNEQNEVAVLYVGKDHYYKLPGGGAEGNESISETLEREVLEEVGCGIEIIDKIGLTIEYRDHFEQIQMSYSYLCRVKGNMGSPEFTQNELEHGFALKWMSFDEAVKRIGAYDGNKYLGCFIKERDTNIIKRVGRILGKYNVEE